MSDEITAGDDDAAIEVRPVDLIEGANPIEDEVQAEIEMLRAKLRQTGYGRGLEAERRRLRLEMARQEYLRKTGVR